MRTIVIYHGGGCADGFCSAWLFSKAFPDAEFMPMNYGDPVPDVSGAKVFVLDFSWKRPEMVRLIEQAAQVVVLDHHATAADELRGLGADPQWASKPNPPEIIFDMGHSGAALSYAWLWNNIPSFRSGADKFIYPRLVRYVEDRDLWSWALPHSKAINAAIRTYPHFFETWNLLNADLECASGSGRLISEGDGILRAEAQTIAVHVKSAREIVLDGHRVLAVNATTLQSEIAGELAAGRAFGACFFDRLGDDGSMTRIWSLRVRDGDFDVGKLAKRFGGGGHKKAAGFQVKL